MTVAPVKRWCGGLQPTTIAYAGADKESLYTQPVEKLNEQLKPPKSAKRRAS